MPRVLTCATLPPTLPLSSPPIFHNPFQKTCISRQDIRTVKTIHVRDLLHARAKQTLSSFHLSLQIYIRAGLMEEARLLFDEMQDRTLVSWTILMSGYVVNGPAAEAIIIFQNMLRDPAAMSYRPDPFIYAVVLRACTVIGDLSLGRKLHCQIIKTNEAIDSFVENALVSMYASCGSVRDSVAIFNRIQLPDLVSWSSMVSGYVQNGYDEEGLKLFRQMGQAGIQPDVFALSMVVGASANISDIDIGTQIHCCIIKRGFSSSLFLDNSLMDFYSSCGDFNASRQIFDAMTERNLISWNTIIAGYVHNLQYFEALTIFKVLMDENFDCDDYTLASILQAVAGLGALDHGREIHAYLIKAGYESNVYVISSLLDMYIECRSESENLDRHNNIPMKVFQCLQAFNEFIIASLLKSCALKSDLEVGKMLHSCIIKLELKWDHHVISSLIDMYANCGAVEAACWVFLGIDDPGTVPWSAIIAGHCQNGLFEQALFLFKQMQLNCVEVNEFTYTSVLLACIALGDFRKGKELHSSILRTGYGRNTSVINTLLKLYTELGCLQQALKLSTSIPDTEVSWGILIQGCARVEDHETALRLFQKVHRTSRPLDHISASFILASCASPVLLNVGIQAQAYVMKTGVLMDPNLGDSLIKMYSGAGDIGHADNAFKKMPEKNSASWISMVSANVAHGQPSYALDLFMQMCWKNKMPDSNTFVSVLKACAQKGLVNEAFHLLDLMEDSYGMEPSNEHYSCMVEVLGRAGMFEDAEAFIEEVIPFNPDAQIWRTLLSSCRIQGNMRLAKSAAEKLLELEPNDRAANLILEQVLLTIGKWADASKLKAKIKFINPSSSWIEIRNYIYEFSSNDIPTGEIVDKIEETERKMEELGYKADKNHWLHNAEEEYGRTAFPHHTEIMALAFGLVWLPKGTPIRILKSMRMCGDCHSACKFVSTFVGRDVVIKDSCSFHHFKYGKCSCRDTW